MINFDNFVNWGKGQDLAPSIPQRGKKVASSPTSIRIPPSGGLGGLTQAILLLILLLIGLTLTQLPAVAQTEAETLTVAAPALNVRSGPGIANGSIGFVLAGEVLDIVSYDAATDWWQVRLSDGRTGWISGGAEYVTVANSTLSSDLVQTEVSTTTHTLVFQTSIGGAIYAVNPDGTNLRYLTHGIDPILSPDGQQVAFTRWETSQDTALGQVWVINIDGTGERVIHDDIRNPRSPTWSADGQALVVSMQHGGNAVPEYKCQGARPPRGVEDIDIIVEGKDDIVFCFTTLPDPYWALRRIDVISGEFEDLPGDTYSFSPTWNPNSSSQVVYDGDRSLMSLDLLTGANQPLTGDVNDHRPVFSPDGGKIAVTYRQTDHWDIHVMNNDGSGRVRLTETSYQTWLEQILNGESPRSFNNASPTWSPDGSQITFLTDRTGQWEIWVMNVDGSEQQPLIDPNLLMDITLTYDGVNEHALSWR